MSARQPGSFVEPVGSLTNPRFHDQEVGAKDVAKPPRNFISQFLEVNKVELRKMRTSVLSSAIALPAKFVYLVPMMAIGS